MQKCDIILASSSPRRKQLLKSLNLDFKILKPGFDELLKQGENPSDYVLRNALGKGEWILNHQLTSLEGDLLIISADTIVCLEGEVLEKPKDKEDSKHMLKKLSGKAHQVYTGLSLIKMFKEKITKEALFVKTDVVFKTLSDQEITMYIKTEEPKDKAGSYGIQGFGAYLVKEINGSYTNVMGLPLTELFELMKKHEII